MNFKKQNQYFGIALIAIITSSCGVKSDPIPPKGTALPSIVQEYTGLDTLDEEKKKKEKKKN